MTVVIGSVSELEAPRDNSKATVIVLILLFEFILLAVILPGVPVP